MRPRLPTLASWTLRSVASGVLVALIGVGCTLDRSLIVLTGTWECSVNVQNAGGEVRTINSDNRTLQGLSPREFVSLAGCDSYGIEDDFLRWVQATLPSRYDFADGPWCLVPSETPLCREAGPAPPGAVCPTPLPDPPTLCAVPTRCLSIAPGEVDYAALLMAQGETEPRSLLGLPEDRISPLPRVVVANTCAEPVRVNLDDSVQGDHPDDFTLLANTCAPDPGMDGRLLAAAGSGGEECSFEVQFTPLRREPRRAEKRISQDTEFEYIVPLSGTVRGGTLGGLPAMRCFDALVGPRAGCGNASAPQTLTLTNISPGRMTIESIVATGAFEVGPPPPPFILEPTGLPGASQSIDVWWCGDGGDIDDDASLLITHNGFSSPAEVLLQRRRAGCP